MSKNAPPGNSRPSSVWGNRRTLQLPAVNLGDTNFEDGFVVPGFLLEEFPDVYITDTLKDSKGATVPGIKHTHGD
jgi:hypothetical protein